LGIQKVHACVGASLGGMLSLCSAANYPDRVGKFVSISACAKSFPGSIAFRSSQRCAVMSDPNWKQGDYYDGPLPAAGLRLARQIGTITYRSGKEWQQRFGQKKQGVAGFSAEGMNNEFMIEHYLTHQGEKWVNNYDPNSMLWISKAMDGFSMEKAGPSGEPPTLLRGLAAAQQPALVIGVQHDVLFPVWQQKEIADSLKAGGNKSVIYYELDSVYGHDAFLLESAAIGPAVKGHLEQEPGGAKHLWEEMASSAIRMLQASTLRSGSADTMRDIFRTLSAGEEEVETDKLCAVVKLVWSRRVSPEKIEQIFAERLPAKVVRLQEFLSIRGDLQRSEAEVYLP